MTPARRLSRVAALSLVCCLLCVGCARRTEVATATDKPPPTQQPWLGQFIEQVRRAQSPPDCREALQVIERHLDTDAAGKKQLRLRAAELRRLAGPLGLTAEEVGQATGGTFGPLDAHHVYLCLQLRDTAESLDVRGLGPLEQAEAAFAWVVRHVALRSGRQDVLTPPEFVLQLGEGSAHERALVFLALLQQLHLDRDQAGEATRLDGCMIAIPAAGPGGRERYWIPGVLVRQKDGKDDIYLFDTRLGLPVPGPGGKGVATLRQVKARPGLLARLGPDPAHPYDVTAEEAARAEVRLVLPLSALAPRLRYVEDQMRRRDRVRLAVDPAERLKRFAAAAGGKVGVWNRPGEAGQPPPWTPTGALRLFLSPAEGGADRTQRWLGEHRQELLATAVILRNYQELVDLDNLPKEARERLTTLAGQLFLKYTFLPRERLARGRVEDATRALTHINGVIQKFNSRAPRGAELAREVAEWRRRLLGAYLLVARQDPAGRKRVEELWSEDQFILELSQLSSEEDEPPREEWKAQWKTLSYLVLAATGEPLDDDAVFLLAVSLQERAEQARGPSAKESRRGSWEDAEGLARQYGNQHPLAADEVHARLQPVLRPWQTGPTQLAVALGLWDHLFRDFARAATARLFRARALRGAGKPDEAREVARRLAEDLAALRQNTDLRAALDGCLKRVPEFASLQQEVARSRLERLLHELGPEGNLAWLERRALLAAAGR
jgi:hypothetical protein